MAKHMSMNINVFFRYISTSRWSHGNVLAPCVEGREFDSGKTKDFKICLRLLLKHGLFRCKSKDLVGSVAGCYLVNTTINTPAQRHGLHSTKQGSYSYIIKMFSS